MAEKNPFRLPVNTFEDFQAALDAKRLWIKEEWNKGPRWYLVRRNGMTKRWLGKKNSHRWEIPIKWKLDTCKRIGDYNFEMWKDQFYAAPGPDIPEHKIEGSKAHFERYVAGDR